MSRAGKSPHPQPMVIAVTGAQHSALRSLMPDDRVSADHGTYLERAAAGLQRAPAGGRAVRLAEFDGKEYRAFCARAGRSAGLPATLSAYARHATKRGRAPVWNGDLRSWLMWRGLIREAAAGLGQEDETTGTALESLIGGLWVSLNRTSPSSERSVVVATPRQVVRIDSVRGRHSGHEVHLLAGACVAGLLGRGAAVAVDWAGEKPATVHAYRLRGGEAIRLKASPARGWNRARLEEQAQALCA